MKKSIMVILAVSGLCVFANSYADSTAKCPKLSSIECNTIPAASGNVLRCTSDDTDDFNFQINTVAYNGNIHDSHPEYMEARFEWAYSEQDAHVVCQYKYFDANFGPAEVLTAISKNPVSRTQLTGSGWVDRGMFGSQCNAGKNSNDCQFRM